jgi:hypothetical protein
MGYERYGLRGYSILLEFGIFFLTSDSPFLSSKIKDVPSRVYNSKFDVRCFIYPKYSTTPPIPIIGTMLILVFLD